MRVRAAGGSGREPGAALLCVIGAVAGVALATRVPQHTLGRAVALLVAGAAGYLLVSGLFLGGPPDG